MLAQPQRRPHQCTEAAQVAKHAAGRQQDAHLTLADTKSRHNCCRICALLLLAMMLCTQTPTADRANIYCQGCCRCQLLCLILTMPRSVLRSKGTVMPNQVGDPPVTACRTAQDSAGTGARVQSPARRCQPSFSNCSSCAAAALVLFIYCVASLPGHAGHNRAWCLHCLQVLPCQHSPLYPGPATQQMPQHKPAHLLSLTHMGASYQLPWPRASTPRQPAAPSIAQRQWMTSLSVKRFRPSGFLHRPRGSKP